MSLPERDGEAARIDREWERERQRYLITGRRGSRYVPSIAASVTMAVFVVGVGAFWFALALDMGQRGNAPLFLLMGTAFVVVGLAISFRQYRQARRYRAAYRAYQGRRAAAEKLAKAIS